jgi:hypothetical protein
MRGGSCATSGLGEPASEPASRVRINERVVAGRPGDQKPRLGGNWTPTDRQLFQMHAFGPLGGLQRAKDMHSAQLRLRCVTNPAFRSPGPPGSPLHQTCTPGAGLDTGASLPGGPSRPGGSGDHGQSAGPDGQVHVNDPGAGAPGVPRGQAPRTSSERT